MATKPVTPLHHSGHLGAALLALAFLTVTLPAGAQSLGMLLHSGLVPGLPGRLLLLAEGPLTGGEGADLAVLPADATGPGGLLIGSQWGDLLFYPDGPDGVYQPPQVWLGADAASWQWPPVARPVSPEVVDWEGNGQVGLLVGWGRLLLWYPREGGTLGAGRVVETIAGRPLADLVREQDPTAGHLAPCVGDFDGDGRPDLLLGADDGSVWWAKNLAEKGFALEAPQRVLGPTAAAGVSARARVAWGDFTGAGTPALLVGGARGELHLYSQMPTGLGPEQVLSFGTPAEPPLVGGLSPRLLPGRKLLLGESGGLVRSVEVSPAGVLTDRGRLQGRQVPLDVGSAPAVCVADTRGNGSADLVIGDAGGRVTVFLNRNQAGGWDLEPGTTMKDRQGAPVSAEGGYAWPLLVDMNGDRRLELLLGTGAGEIELWLGQNGLIRGAPLTAGAGPIQAAGPATLAVGDWNGDGKPDLFVGCRPGPAVESDKTQVRPGQVAFFENEAQSRTALPLFNKGTLLDVQWRKANSGGTLGRLPNLGLTLLQPLTGLTTPHFLALGQDATYLLDCENAPPFYPLLTLTVPSASPPAGLLPALYSIWVTHDPTGRPQQVLCGLAEYGMVCVFPAEALGLR
ncbi:MAG TPA: VCBS repeat-containing protein [Armatimonadota bacterium]|jgi:hypothetical protein